MKVFVSTWHVCAKILEWLIQDGVGISQYHLPCNKQAIFSSTETSSQRGLGGGEDIGRFFVCLRELKFDLMSMFF